MSSRCCPSLVSSSAGRAGLMWDASRRIASPWRAPGVQVSHASRSLQIGHRIGLHRIVCVENRAYKCDIHIIYIICNICRYIHIYIYTCNMYVYTCIYIYTDM